MGDSSEHQSAEVGTLEAQGEAGCPAVGMYLILLNVHFIIVKMVYSMFCVFYHNLNK